MRFTTAQRLIVAASLLLLVIGALLLAAGCVPLETLKPLGAMIRRADDVTRERYFRFVGACWFLGVLSFVMGAVLFRFRAIAGAWLAIVCGAVPTWMAVPFRSHAAWGPEVWCVIALGVGLRLVRLNDPMAYDEAYTFLNFARRPWYEAISDYNSTNNHLFNTFCMHWCYRWFGAGESSLRIPVLISGIATLCLTYSWAKAWRGRRTALLATALVAVSPMMITYSVDARGYMFVTAAALAMDAAAGAIDRDPQRNRGSWCWLTLAAIVGLWSMPIMLYAVLATSIWFVLAPLARSSAVPTQIPAAVAVRGRAFGLLLSGAVVVLAVGAFYAPAFIFRGLTFLRDPIMVKVSLAEAPRALATSFVGAWNWWTEGMIPHVVWAIALAAGVAMWSKARGDWLRLLMPIAVVIALNLLQRVAPPPRIYLFLFPWVALLSAHGVIRLFEEVCDRAPASAKLGSGGPLVAAWAATAAVCCAGGWYVKETPVLFNAAERASFYSLRDVMEQLAREIRSNSTAGPRSEGDAAAEAGTKNRLIAPLPCDLPARFYRERDGIPVEVNESPNPGESLWLITRHGESAAQVLASPLVNLPGYSEPGMEWKLKESFQTLRLHHYAPRDEAGDGTQSPR